MILYLACGGVIAALDGASGRELWRTELPEWAGKVSVLESGGMVFVGTWGRAYGLDAKTGKILWKNGLSGMKYHEVHLTVGGRTGS